MRTWLRAGAVAAGALVACKFAPAGFGDSDSNQAADAGLCTGLSAACADPETLRTCLGSGMLAVDTKCPWGCVGPTSHCGEFVPSGGGVNPVDLNPDGALLDTNLNGTINGDDGSIAGPNPRSSGDNGMIKGGIGYYRRGNISVFRFKSILVSGRVVITGAHPVALVATDTITINDQIDATGGCSGSAAGPGGFSGAPAHTDALGSGAGSGGLIATLGGGGGGNGSGGGNGGNTVAIADGPAGGPAFGDPQITVLIGGGGGGGGGGGSMPKGGGGGGALQLVAGTTITIMPAGEINAGGCGGTGGAANDSGGGGGAGGTLLLEAFDIIISGSLGVNGGAGGGAGNGGGNNGGDGDDAAVARGLAAGGTSQNGSGGAGAGGSVMNGFVGFGGTAHSGGGGGAVGRIRINTRTGSASIVETNLSPAPSDPGTTCTLGSAAVQ